jgi:2,5-diketo-D-gluconate reductase A
MPSSGGQSTRQLRIGLARVRKGLTHDFKHRDPEHPPLRGSLHPAVRRRRLQVPPEDTTENVLAAIEAGYRHIDTAKAYGNEAGVGQAIRASGLDRSEFFVTTKCFNDDHGYDSATRALKTSLDQLEMEYVDLYLIHWPVPSQDRYAETWQAFIEGQQAGLARTIGVSNFQPDRLRRIIDETGVTPAVNQIELHPYLQQAGLRREHADRGIVTEAWSPIAQGLVLDDPAIVAIAEAHGKTPAQVVLRWHIELGIVVSRSRSRSSGCTRTSTSSTSACRPRR